VALSLSLSRRLSSLTSKTMNGLFVKEVFVTNSNLQKTPTSIYFLTTPFVLSFQAHLLLFKITKLSSPNLFRSRTSFAALFSFFFFLFSLNVYLTYQVLNKELELRYIIRHSWLRVYRKKLHHNKCTYELCFLNFLFCDF